MKHCTACKSDKPLTAFPLTKAHGYRVRRSWCSDCCREYRKRKHQEAREAKTAALNQWIRGELAK